MIDRTLSTTTDPSFAALACYAFGPESLHIIDTTSGRAIFSFSVASEDFKILQNEFLQDQPTGGNVIQAYSFCRALTRVNQLVWEARRAHGQWVSEGWKRGDR
jgi:catabolite regulation protein CreA